ncbi:hypothetical protein BC833DRAFT_590248 [Globomyces pollinis-pini]|nr:hypothetical protein BC833DRAFT_590248 [Globomyces pollinis-pini]
MQHLQNSILSFWLGTVRKGNYSKDSISQASKLWFGIGRSKEETATLDQYLTENFKLQVDEFKTYQDLCKEPEGLLAFCILGDQFTRNIYRGQSKAFINDSHVLQQVKLKLDDNFHQTIHPIERQFMFLPLMHSEDYQDHLLAKRYYEETIEDSNKNFEVYIKQNVEFGLRYLKSHTDIIERFGRYPHRNLMLNRENTKEEEMYLNSKEFNSFGQ